MRALYRVCYLYTAPPGLLNHGNHFHDLYIPCEADPSSWCSLFTGEIGPNFTQYRYESYHRTPQMGARCKLPPASYWAIAVYAHQVHFTAELYCRLLVVHGIVYTVVLLLYVVSVSARAAYCTYTSKYTF